MNIAEYEELVTTPRPPDPIDIFLENLKVGDKFFEKDAEEEVIQIKIINHYNISYIYFGMEYTERERIFAARMIKRWIKQ